MTVTTGSDRLRQVPTGRERTAAWFGQAGFAVAAGGRMALIDPVPLAARGALGYDPSMTPSSASGVDLVLCTHEHLDHW